MNTSKEFSRGQRDANKFAMVRNVAGSWQGVTTWDYQDCFIIEPSDDYLDGLQDGGCNVMRNNERRVSRLENTFNTLLERIAYVMQ